MGNEGIFMEIAPDAVSAKFTDNAVAMGMRIFAVA